MAVSAINYLPPFANSLIMHVLTNAEKLIPLRDAASLAESRRLAGMRMVTGTTSPSTRYERISVSPASCSIKSEYVIASHAFKPQYKCINYTPAWEQRKLGELIQLGGSGGTPSANNPDYYGGDIPFLSIADINGRDITNTAKTLTDEGLQNSAAWIVPSGAVSLAMYASVGKVGIIRQDTATSQAFYNMAFDNEALRDFVFTRLEKAEADSEWEPYISTGTQRNLNADKVKSFSLDVPSNEEASEISAYFANLDDLITLHQRKRQWLKWLDEGGEGTHHDIDILVFKFADDMKISVLCGVHACMTKSLGYTGNRYAGKQQQRGMGVP